MEYGVILKWLKKEGDKVKKGDLVVEIFGEKNEFELEAPADGVILKILCNVDDEIPISEPIAYIGEEGEKVPDARPRKMNAAAATPTTTTVAFATSTATSATKAKTATSPAVESSLPDGRVRLHPGPRRWQRRWALI
jgi:pyruvate/2-oxoglutarate dehydrogenase complex dihydrolipoamide acyltransferase (E2) component